MKAASGVPRELELAATLELGWDDQLESTLGRLVDGTRRDLVVWPENLVVEHVDEHRIELAFTLPAGSYATLLLQEFTRGAAPGPEGRSDSGADWD